MFVLFVSLEERREEGNVSVKTDCQIALCHGCGPEWTGSTSRRIYGRVMAYTRPMSLILGAVGWGSDKVIEARVLTGCWRSRVRKEQDDTVSEEA